MINPIAAIKALFSVQGTIREDLKEAQAMDGAKAGWKTSTFWVKVLTVDAPVLYMAIKGFLPAKTAALIEVSALGLYAIYRTVIDTVKQIQSVQTGTTTQVDAQTVVVNK